MKSRATSKTNAKHPRSSKHEPKRPVAEVMRGQHDDNSEEAVAQREREAGIKRL